MTHTHHHQNLETSILGLGELEHMNQLYVSGMLQRIKNYNVGNAASSPGSVKVMASRSDYFVKIWWESGTIEETTVIPIFAVKT